MIDNYHYASNNTGRTGRDSPTPRHGGAAGAPGRMAGDRPVARNTLSRLLNGRLGISPRMALALERIGWSTADHWMRLQAAYDLAQERRKQAAA